MKAALYARFSSDLQRATSIEDQYRNCRKRAEAEGWSIVATFADQAMTGSDASRPQYQAMIDAALRNDFEVLIVDDLSRLTRDSVEAERTIRRLESTAFASSRPATVTTPPARPGKFIAVSKD